MQNSGRLGRQAALSAAFLPIEAKGVTGSGRLV
jgi:hypothetical protein